MSEKNEISNKKNITKSLVLKPCGEIVYEKNNNINKNNNISQIVKSKSKLSSLEIYNKILELPEFKKPESIELILNEDEYLNNLEEIITRDYFPDLHKYNQIKKQVKFFLK
jgi:hypothetical protein